jgi:hypothetical protein
MQGNLVGVTFRQFVVDKQGRPFPVPDGLDQHVLCRICAEYFEAAFNGLASRAAERQSARAARGGAS